MTPMPVSIMPRCLIFAVLILTACLGGQFIYLKDVQNDVVVEKQKAVIAEKKAAMYALENAGLRDQHEKSLAQLEVYEKRNRALHDEIVTKLNTFEKRTDQMQQELSNEINKVWANQPIPTGVSRLLNERSRADSHSQNTGNANSRLPSTTDLPSPNAKPQTK